MKDVISRMILVLQNAESDMAFSKRTGVKVDSADYKLLHENAVGALLTATRQWNDANLKRIESAGFNVFKHNGCIVFNTKHGNITVKVEDPTLPDKNPDEWYSGLQNLGGAQ